MREGVISLLEWHTIKYPLEINVWGAITGGDLPLYRDFFRIFQRLAPESYCKGLKRFLAEWEGTPPPWLNDEGFITPEVLQAQLD